MRGRSSIMWYNLVPLQTLTSPHIIQNHILAQLHPFGKISQIFSFFYSSHNSNLVTKSGDFTAQTNTLTDRKFEIMTTAALRADVVKIILCHFHKVLGNKLMIYGMKWSLTRCWPNNKGRFLEPFFNRCQP